MIGDMLRADGAFRAPYDDTLVAFPKMHGPRGMVGRGAPSPSWSAYRITFEPIVLAEHEMTALVEDFKRGHWLTFEYGRNGRIILWGLIEPVSLGTLVQRSVTARRTVG